MRIDDDYYGEIEEISEVRSDDEDTDTSSDTLPPQPSRSPSKRKGELRSSQKNTKVTFASSEYRQHIIFLFFLFKEGLYYLKMEPKFKRKTFIYKNRNIYKAK